MQTTTVDRPTPREAPGHGTCQLRRFRNATVLYQVKGKEVTSMKRNRIIALVTRMLLVVSLVFGVVALTGTTAQAQRGHGFDGHRHRVPSRVFVYPRIYPRGWYWHNRWSWYGSGYPYHHSYYFPSTHVSEGQGYRDGLDDGKDDARDGKANDPYRHKDYKDAVTSAYIGGYLRGYAEGYRQVSG